MRIAVLSRNFVSTGGGAERYAIAVAEQLSADHEVHVFAQQVQHAHPKLTYHVLPHRIDRPRWINQLLFAFQAWRETRTGFDIVHSHENVWHGNVQAVHVLPAKHGLFFGRTGFTWALQFLRVITSPRLLTYLGLELIRFAPQKHRRIVAASGALAAAMRQAYPDTDAMMTVIEPGVDMPCATIDPAQDNRTYARVQLGLPTVGLCVLFVGNDFQKKGLPALIRAFALLSESLPDLFITVVGNSAQRDAMLTIARDEGVATRIHFVGSLGRMELAYRAADCLVHPTLQDSYAMAVLEALAYGLPVVVSASPYCGIADDLVHGVNALLLPDPRDVVAISEHIQVVLYEEQVRQRLVANGLEFARRHTWSTAGVAHAKVFAEVIA